MTLEKALKENLKYNFDIYVSRLLTMYQTSALSYEEEENYVVNA